MLGLGFKAPLAYSSSFYFICRKDGVERKYMMFEGEDVNEITLLHETDTTERNGVKVIVPVNYGDRSMFWDKIRQQLAYFESVYFDCGDSISNDFLIYRADTYQHSAMYKGNMMHLCLDNVYYPVDWDKLGIKSIPFPVALRFSLTEGLMPTPNREALIYSKTTKDKILNKIKEVAEIFLVKYNDSIKETDDVAVVRDYYTSSDRFVEGFVENTKLKINCLFEYAKTKQGNCKLKGITKLNLDHIFRYPDTIMGEYTVVNKLEGIKFTKSKWDTTVHVHDILRLEYYKFYLIGDEWKVKNKDWVRHLHKVRVGVIVKKIREFTLGYRKKISSYGDVTTYFQICNLGKHKRGEWRDIIKEFKYVQSLLLQKFVDVSNVVFPQDWLDSRKKARIAKVATTGKGRRVKLQGEITVKRADSLQRYVSGQNCKFVSDVLKLEQIPKDKLLTIYGGTEDTDTLDKLFSISSMRLVSLSNQELKKIEKAEIHNFMSLNKFMEGKNKPFKRLVTAYLIDQLHEQYNHVFENLEIMKEVSQEVASKMEKLNKYREKHYKDGDESIYKAMLEISITQNLWDTTIHGDYLKIKEMLEKFSFLKIIFKQMNNYTSDKNMSFIPILLDLFKYNKQKINWDKYKINDIFVASEIVDE